MKRINYFLMAILFAESFVLPRDTKDIRSKDLERAVTLMAKIGSCFSPTLSPDGKTIAFVSNITGSPQIWTVPTGGGWPDLVTAFDDPVGAVRWSPSGEYLAFSIAPGGGMNQQVYVIRPDGSQLRRVTDGGKENNWLGVWTRDGRGLTLASNRRRRDAMDAYVTEISGGSLRLVTENRGIGSFSDVSRDNKLAILTRTLSRGNNDLYLVDLSTGTETLLTRHEGPSLFAGVFGKTSSIVYLSSNKDRDLTAFARINISENGKPGPIQVIAERSDAELDGFEINDQGTLAALIWNVAGRSELSFLDLVQEKMTPGPKLPAEIAGGLTFSKDGNLLAMVLSGSSSPTNVWILDLRTQQFRQITKSPHARVNLKELVRPELVRFKSHDGLELSGWLYRSRDSKHPGPIVLSFHGGPEGQERPSFRSDYQALLSQGIAVFAPNVRGSAGFGKKFVNLDNGALRANAVEDIKSCVDYLVSREIADPKRVGIMGGSYGGYMVMAGLTEYPTLFAAGADLFGIINFETFFEHTEPWMAAISTVEYGDPKTELNTLQRLSPIHKVDRVVAPTIVLHGANDTNVPVIEAEQVVKSLKKRKIPVEYILFSDEGHGWRKTPNQIRSTVAITRWFVQHLKVANTIGR